MKILVIDDDSEYCDSLIDLLSSVGHEVEGLLLSTEVMTKLANTTYDLIVTDVIMPDIDGMALIKCIKSKYPDQKVIAISGGGRISANVHLDMIKHHGADDVLEKPFSIEKITDKINQLFTT